MSVKNYFLVFFFLLSAFYVPAQWSAAYIDINPIIANHPEMIQLTQRLSELEQQVQEKISVQQNYYNSKVNDYHTRQERGIAEDELNTLENEIYSLQESIQQMIQQEEVIFLEKKEDWMAPLYDKVQTAINNFASDQKLDCVLQQTNIVGVSVVLYAPEDKDLSLEIMRSLGIKEASATQGRSKFSANSSKSSIGYTNLELVLNYMPEYRAMEQQLGTYGEKLEEQLKEKEAGFQIQYAEYLEKEATQSLPQEALDNMMKELISLDQEISTLKAGLEQKLSDKRSALMEPLLLKLEKAITDVAEEADMAYILNQTTSSGVSTILFGPENANITTRLLEILDVPTHDSSVKPVALQNPRVGYVNIELLLQNMPENNQIDIQLREFRQRKEEELKLKQQALQKELANYQELLEANRMSELDRSALEEDLQMKDKDLTKQIEDAELYILNKQSELLGPILDKIQKVIDALVKEKEYTFILNQTSGLNIIYVNPADDMTKHVQERLQSH